jgi:GTP cyclohydrolase II
LALTWPSHAHTVTAQEGITTGISAAERTATVRALADGASTADTFVRPGHVFPLRYREGGVLRRAGHTEAAVDLSRLAGCAPVGVLCEVRAAAPLWCQRDASARTRTHSWPAGRACDERQRRVSRPPCPVKLSRVPLPPRVLTLRACPALRPSSAQIVNDADGSMARCPALLAFGQAHGLKVMLISDLIRYRRAREAHVERTAVARLPTAWGAFSAYSYRSHLDGIEHVAMVMGDIGDGANVLTRVHSECLTGDIFASARCDCGPQLSAAMARVAKEGRGVIVYLRGQEGRGIGLGHKLRAYNLQDNGRDTVQANEDLGLPVDSREYGIGAQILRDIGVRSLRLMTNNPAKYSGLRGHGLTVVGRVPLLTPINPENKRYIETKREKMGHWGDELVAAEEAAPAPTAGAGTTVQ